MQSFQITLECVQVREGLYYNPYFPGGAIAMPKMLADGGTEYEDEEIPSTESQQAKVLYCLHCNINMLDQISLDSLPCASNLLGWTSGCCLFFAASCLHPEGSDTYLVQLALVI